MHGYIVCDAVSDRLKEEYELNATVRLYYYTTYSDRKRLVPFLQRAPSTITSALDPTTTSSVRPS